LLLTKIQELFKYQDQNTWLLSNIKISLGKKPFIILPGGETLTLPRGKEKILRCIFGKMTSKVANLGTAGKYLGTPSRRFEHVVFVCFRILGERNKLEL